MNNWLVPIIVALGAPLLAYLGIARKLSGRIATSEAANLWEEATQMREEWQRRATECEQQVLAARNEIQILTARNTELTRQVREMRNALRGRQ